MADRQKDIRLFQRAAAKRLEAARFLLEHGYNLDAVYLGGYAVECALKAYILHSTPNRGHWAMLVKLTEVGALGHDIEYLTQVLKKVKGTPSSKNKDVFGKVPDSMHTVTTWSTNLRYEVAEWPQQTARHFVSAVEAICDWCLRG